LSDDPTFNTRGCPRFEHQVAELPIHLNPRDIRHALVGLGADHDYILVLRRLVAPPPFDVRPDGLGRLIYAHHSPMITQGLTVPASGSVLHGRRSSR